MLTRALGFMLTSIGVCLLIAPFRVHAQIPGQSLGVASVPNLRDLGGYETGDHAIVRDKLVYRSNQLAPVSAADELKISALGLKNDYDLRTEDERKAHPDELPASVVNVWLNVIADEQHSPAAELANLLRNPKEANSELGDGKAELFMEKTYRDFVSLPSARAAYRRLFIALSEPSNLPAVFHCTAGKDRTGWAAAALLSILGVPRNVVVADYLRSNEYLLPVYRRQIDGFVAGGGDPTIPPALFGVKEEYLQAAFDEVKEKYGGINQYFSQALGIDAAAQKRLRQVLLAKE
jgi:protein-tyrosine phosphatase